MDELNYNLVKEQPYHTIIAGSTGSGKSVLMHKLIKQVINNSYVYLCDIKRVELARYRKHPNVLAYEKSYGGIEWLLKRVLQRVEQRYKKMERRGEVLSSEPPIFVFVDEFADLIVTDRKRYEPLLVKISQIARAARVTLVLATQAPNRRVLTANLMLNMNIRIGLHCNDPIESRQIIGEKGCELLPLYGTCIVRSPRLNGTYRITL